MNINFFFPELTDKEEERQKEVHFPGLKPKRKTRCVWASYTARIQSQVEIEQCIGVLFWKAVACQGHKSKDVPFCKCPV